MSYLGRQLNVPASTVQLTAEGAITAGKPLIVEADGDVAQIIGAAQGVGTSAVFESATSGDIGIAYDANAQKVVIVYYDGGNSNYGTAVVGTVSGSSISFGTPVVYNSASSQNNVIAYDSNAQKVVIAFEDFAYSGGHGSAIVGTVSGTSISFGAKNRFEQADTEKVRIAYDANAQKVVVVYYDDADSDYGKAAVGTISSTSISFGTAVTFNSAQTSEIDIAYDSDAQKVVVAYKDLGNSDYGTAIVGTVSGTSISFGTEVVFESAASNRISAAYDSSAQKTVIAYSDIGNSSYGTAVVGTVSGTSISFGTPVVWAETDASSYISTAYDENAEKTVIAYRDKTATDGNVIAGAVSGTSITFDSSVEFESDNADFVAAAYDQNAKKVVIAYQDDGNSSYGTGIVFTTGFTNLTSENFIGFAKNDCTDNGLATIQLGGSVNDKQTSLTAGQTYFVQTDGTIGTTADSPSVTAGTAVSATEILVKG